MTLHLTAIELHETTTAEEFLAALSPSRPWWEPDPTRWCFRAQDWDEPLIPSSLRSSAFHAQGLLGPPENLSEAPRQLFEFDAVRAFLHAADRAGLAIPHDSPLMRNWTRLRAHVVGVDRDPDRAIDSMVGVWPTDELLAVLALAQHYGVPTRLLDWSYRPMVAAYFAAAQIAKEGAGIATSTPRYDRNRALVVWGLNMAMVPLNFPSRDPKTHRLAIVEAPQATNPNLAAQAGLFTLDREAEPDEGLEASLPSLLEKYAEMPRVDELDRVVLRAMAARTSVFHKFTLPHAEARRLLRLLGLHGVSAATVFPGHKGVVDSLFEKKAWEK